MPSNANADPRMRQNYGSPSHRRTESIDVSCSTRSKLIFSKLLKSKSHGVAASQSSAREMQRNKEKQELKAQSSARDIQRNKEKQELKAASQTPDRGRVRDLRSSESVAHSKMTLRKFGEGREKGRSTGHSQLVAAPRKVEAEVQIKMPMDVQTNPLFSLAGTASKDSDSIIATESADSKENQNSSVKATDDENNGLAVPKIHLMPLESSHLEEVEKKVQTLNELQKIVTQLQSTVADDQWIGAAEVRRIAKDDGSARVTLAMLGAIPPLISMLDSAQPKIQSTALLALLNLAIGNEINKAAIVKARAIPIMVKLLRSPHAAVQEAVVTAFLSLSALDGNKAEIGASGAVSMLVHVLETGSMQSRKDALRALYNLSIHPGNVRSIVEAGAAPLLLGMVEEEATAEKALATLSNMAMTEDGRKAIADQEGGSYGVLIEALRWMDAPKCQERAVFVLMMVAHHSRKERQPMVNEGAISALLELALLGTTLAQKRAARTLESFRRAKAVRPVSAPQQGMVASTESKGGKNRSAAGTEDRQVVNQLVRQSLNRNMQRIFRRANLPSDDVRLKPSSDRLLSDSPSSRSLPF